MWIKIKEKLYNLNVITYIRKNGDFGLYLNYNISDIEISFDTTKERDEMFSLIENKLIPMASVKLNYLTD